MTSPPTGNMGLTVWDQDLDFYDFHQLANNWEAIDNHDHTSGRGRLIPSEGLANGAVINSKIAAGAVTAVNIQNATITEAKLAPNSVGAPEIIDGSVGTNELADGSVTNAKLASGLVLLGEVVMWYRQNTSVPIPSGSWEVCDGRPWSSIPNSLGYSTGNIPDMRNKFPLGAATTGIGAGPTQNPDIGQTGGAHTIDLTHTHTTTHTHTIAAHTHTVPQHSHSITSDGSHAHSYNHAFGSGNFLISRDKYQLNTSGNIINDRQAVRMSGIPDDDTETDVNISMTPNGSHNHGSATGNYTITPDPTPLTTDPTTPTSSPGLSVLDKRPGYVGLLFLMRVR